MIDPGADRLFALAWEATPLGPAARWPSSLRAAVELMLSVGAPAALFVGPHLVQMHNRAFDIVYRDALAAAAVLSRSLRRDDPASPLAKAAAQVFAGHSVVLAAGSWRRNAPPDGPDLTLSCAPLRGEDGKVSVMLALAFPVADRSTSVADPEVRELQHRMRNLLAIVRSLVARSAESSDTVEDLAIHLEGRIAALARVHGVLLRNPGAGVNLEGLVREELLAQCAEEGRLSLDGPEVILPPKAAELLTLAIQELATNATKFGALSQTAGTLRIAWRLHAAGAPAQRLEIVWQEQGVRVAGTAPRREGFGTNLLRRRLPYELAGEAEWMFRPGGLVCRIAFPLAPQERFKSSPASRVKAEEKEWAWWP